MKQTKKYIILLILLIINLYCVSNTITYSTIYNVSNNTTIDYNDTIILEAGISISDNITLTNNGVIISNTDLTISTGKFINNIDGILDINSHDMFVTSPTPTHEYLNGCHVTNNGLIKGNGGNFSLYPSDNPYNSTNSVSFNNYGTMNMLDCEFIIRSNNKQWASFTNESNGSIYIDNDSTKNVHFGLFGDGVQMCDLGDNGGLSTALYLKPSSEFYIKNTNIDIYMAYPTPNSIEGTLIVDDGNIYIRDDNGGGGNIFTIDLPLGGIFISDTDNSGGDGLLSIAGDGGNTTFNIDGTLYTEGIITETTGGGNNIIVGDGGFAFVGNLGASMVDQFTLNVEGGGTLNYCGNVVKDFGDDIGTIQVNGILNYAQSFYTDNPLIEDDFIVNGNMYPLYEDSTSCDIAFSTGIYNRGNNTNLPIELIYFDAKQENGYINLHWATASEVNNDYFTLYKSNYAIDFYEIGKESGIGTTSTTTYYSFIDYNIKGGINYYKLKQTDFNGDYTYSNIIVLNVTHDTFKVVNVTRNSICLEFSSTSENNIYITDISGKSYYNKNIIDKHEYNIEILLPSGVYILTVDNGITTNQVKFIIR